MRWYNAYFEVTVHQELLHFFFNLRFFSLDFVSSFPDNSSYSFHRITLKLGEHLDMRWYSAHCFEVTVHQILIELLRFLKIFQTTVSE